MKIDKLVSAVKKTLEQTADEVKEGVDKALNESAKEGVNRLKTGSPERTGRYASNWTTKKSTRRSRHSRIFYNKDYGSLTHLLEHGHATRGGGRKTKPQEHIGPVEEYVILDFEKKLESIFK